MGNLPDRSKKIIVLSVVALIVFTIAFVIWAIFYQISYYITGYLSFLLFLVWAYLMLWKIWEMIVFPGSSWFWRRSMESSFWQELSRALYADVQIFRTGLEILLTISPDQEKHEFFRSPQSISHAKKRIQSTIRALHIMRTEETLSQQSSTLLEKLENLESMFKSTTILFTDTEKWDMWEWIESTLDENEWLQCVFDDFPHNMKAKVAREACQDLEAMLLLSFEHTPALKSIQRWATDTKIGTLDYMRAEIILRMNAEQVWVQTEDGNKLDCLWIPSLSEGTSAPTILRWNPNAGYYEFSMYQSEWIRFYQSQGLNLMLWNYRGYGRSTGRITPKNIKSDTYAISSYLKEKRRVQRLGVHGESLGGAAACYLANKNQINFLFADRTFSSLSDIAFYMFGWPAKIAMKWIYEDFDTASDFYEAQCYKVVSSDPVDQSIPDLASCKTGVAIKCLREQQIAIENHNHIISKHDSDLTVKAVNNLMQLIYHTIKTEEEREGEGQSALAVELTKIIGSAYQTPSYAPLANDFDYIDDEQMFSILFKLCNILDELDAGGKPLSYLYNHKKGQGLQALSSWLMVFDTYGSMISVSPLESDFRKAATLKLEKLVGEIEALLKESEILAQPMIIQICKDISQLHHFMAQVLAHITRVNTPYSPEQIGHLIPLTCGHNGMLSVAEHKIYERHLSAVGFIKK